MGNFTSYVRAIEKNINAALYRNAVTTTSVIFAAVSVLLLVFGALQEAIFLSSVLILNIVIGTVQELRAKVALERLQILMTPQIKKITFEGTSIIKPEEISTGDHLAVALGNQIPADGNLLETTGIEVNEALLTGESRNISKKIGDQVFGGSIVVAGSGVIAVATLPAQSYVSQMTAKVKQYAVNLSPIERSLTSFIRYMTYLLMFVVLYVLIRGLTTQDLLVSIVKDIAAITGTLVPQGLILATTIFFTYGAVRLYKKDVLLQEINSTEKIGRIKNLCIDKTGTLTENVPTLLHTISLGQQSIDLINHYALAYFKAAQDTSHIAQAIKDSLPRIHFSAEEVLEILPFSSERKYGAVRIQKDSVPLTIVLGAPDLLLPYIRDEDERKLMHGYIERFTRQAKRLILLGTVTGSAEVALNKDTNIKPAALYVLHNPLRPGTKEIIEFFQERGVKIRVISGDNPETVRAIAREAGMLHTDILVTGQEMERWDDEEYEERVPAYHLFARISPNQKERIIEVLKRSGFTAMVGDGANDALAIKKSDLGIAMFDGAEATRQIAQVVLLNNSFAALPEGIRLAETIITNVELVASIFFNKVAIGLSLFLVVAALGYTYPLSPRNITLIGYFTIAFPILFWAMFPVRKERPNMDEPFLQTVLPFSLMMGFTTALAGLVVFLLGPEYLRHASSHVLVVLVFIALGFWFFVLAPKGYGATVEPSKQKYIFFLGAAVAAFLAWVFSNAALSSFFDLAWPGWWPFLLVFCTVVGFAYLQFLITERFFILKAK